MTYYVISTEPGGIIFRFEANDKTDALRQFNNYRNKEYKFTKDERFSPYILADRKSWENYDFGKFNYIKQCCKKSYEKS